MTTNFKKIQTLKTVCLGKVNRFNDDDTTVKNGVKAPLITKGADVFVYNDYGYVLNSKNPGFKDREVYKCHFDISKKEHFPTEVLFFLSYIKHLQITQKLLVVY